MNLLERATAIGIHGFQHCSELEALVDLACGKHVLEIGSFMGLTAWAMAPVAKSVYCVDHFSSATDGQRRTESLTTLDSFLSATNRFNNVRHFVGTSAEAAAEGSPPIAPIQPSEQFDMIFLDAMHTLPEVRADIQRWWPRLKVGGLFVMHDVDHKDFPGVRQAIDEVFPQGMDGQVITLAWITKK